MPTTKNYRRPPLDPFLSVRDSVPVFRPLVEQLESRQLLAFDLTISPTATANVARNVVANITQFAATAHGANVSLSDIDRELILGQSVIVTTGSQGAEDGNISTTGFIRHSFPNAAGTFLFISAGLDVKGDAFLSGLQLANPGTLNIQAGRDVTLGDVTKAAVITVTATGGLLTTPKGSELDATNLSLTAHDGLAV